MKKRKKLLALLCAAALMQCLFTVPSFAYFNRGTVSMQLGQSSINLAAGKSASVSVTIDPIKEQQLPGCGMAECPQSCGNTGCLNEYGECTCGGTSYQTYYSGVKAVSGNSSVATASYGGGMLTIKGMSAGKTTITVTGSMRQYTSSTKTISVTVTTDSAGGGTQAQKKTKDSGGADGERQDGAKVTSVDPTGDDAISGEDISGNSSAEQDPGAADGSKVMETKRGVYEMVPLDENTDVKSYLQAALDHQRFVTFQQKTGENVEYSWTFDGTKLTEAEDIDLSVDITTEIPEKIRKQIGGEDALFFDFSHEGNLPAEAEFYAGVSSVFRDGDVLTLYQWGEDGNLEPAAEDISVENGYVTFSLDHCSSYVLTGASPAKGSINTAAAAGIGAAVLIILAAGVLIIRKKRG